MNGVTRPDEAGWARPEAVEWMRLEAGRCNARRKKPMGSCACPIDRASQSINGIR